MLTELVSEAEPVTGQSLRFGIGLLEDMAVVRCMPGAAWLTRPGTAADTKQPSRIASWYNLTASAAVPKLTVSPVRCG